MPRNFTSKTPTNKRKDINSVSKTREWKGEEWKAGRGRKGGRVEGEEEKEAGGGVAEREV